MIHVMITASLVLLIIISRSQLLKMYWTANTLAEADNEENTLAFTKEFMTMFFLCLGWLILIVCIYFNYWR